MWARRQTLLTGNRVMVAPVLLHRVKSKARNIAFERLVRTKPRADLIRLGTVYGGWWVPRDLLSRDSVCYLAGLGEDDSFDTALIDEFGCEVWAMDPTPRSITFAASINEPRFHFLPVGLWSSETELRFYVPRNPRHVSHSVVNAQKTTDYFVARCVTTRSIMEELGHERLDLLKMNIEGAETEVLKDLLQDGPLPRVLCVALEAPEPIWTTLNRVRALEDVGYTPVKAQGHTVTLVRGDLE